MKGHRDKRARAAFTCATQYSIAIATGNVTCDHSRMGKRQITVSTGLHATAMRSAQKSIEGDEMRAVLRVSSIVVILLLAALIVGFVCFASSWAPS